MAPSIRSSEPDVDALLDAELDAELEPDSEAAPVLPPIPVAPSGFPRGASEVAEPDADDPTRLHIPRGTWQPPLTDGLSPDELRERTARDLAELCEKELEGKLDTGRAGRVHYELGRLYEGSLVDLEKAEQHYLQSQKFLPEHVPTLRGARRVLVARGHYGRALPLFDIELRLTSDPQKKAMLLYERGVLLEDRLGQRREARQAFSLALELDETNPTLLKALERADIATASWDELDKTYERTANSISSDLKHRAAVIAERARIVEAKRRRPEAATELYETALGVDPRAPGAVYALKGLLYAQKRWRDLIAVHEQEAELASDANVRAMARYRAARLQLDHLGNLDEAIELLEQAAKDTPEDTMILEEIAGAYELGKRWGPLAKALENLAARAPSSSQRVGTLHRIGQIYQERLLDESAAIEWYRHALEADPGYQPALQALGHLYTEQQQWSGLIAMHLGESGSTSDAARRAAAHARVAEIFERRLGSVDKAIEHHVRSLGLVPGYPVSFKALSRLYSEGKQYRQLVELYERAVDEASQGETKITYLFMIGRVHEDALSAPQDAVHAYKRILEIDSKHQGAIHAVQRAAERAEMWDQLLEYLDYEAEIATSKSERVALLHRAGEIAGEKLGDADGAMDRFKKVVALDERYAPALSSLGRMYYAAGRWEDLLGVYRLELRVTEKGADTAALLFKMGELAEERIGRGEDATRNYRQALEADPTHVPSVHALVRLLSEKGDWKEVVRLIETEAAALDQAEDRARAEFRAGMVYENRLGLPERALGAYEKALALVPHFRPALDGRLRLLEQAKKYKSLTAALGADADSASDPQIAIAARFRQGEIWRDQIEDNAAAIEAFEAVLARDPNHLGAWLALESLYAATSRWDKLNENYSAQARLLQNGFARVAVLREQARLQERQSLVELDDLTQTYLSIVRMSPADASALGTLERVGLQNRDWTLLSHVDAKLGSVTDDPALAAAYQTRLAESLEVNGDPSALDTYRAVLARDPDNMAAALGLARLAVRSADPDLMSEAAQAEARVLKHPDRAAEILIRAAEVRASRGDVSRAADDLEQALELYPDHPSIADELVRLRTSTGEFDRLLDALTRAAGAAARKERRAALWVHVAELHAEQGRDFGAGLSALGRATKELPRYVPALMLMADLYVRDGQWTQAGARLTEVIGVAQEQETLVAANLQLAWLLVKQLDDPARAETSLKAVLAIDETHRGALKLLLDIQIARGEFHTAAKSAADLAAAATTDAERAEAFAKVALLERKKGDRGRAADAYRQAIAIMGTQGATAGEFKALLAEQKQHGEAPSYRAYADGLSDYLASVTPDATHVPLFLELGRVLDDQLGEHDRGITALRRGLELTPADAVLRAEVARRLRAAGHFGPAADELRQLLELDVMNIETWRDLVDVLDQLGRKDLARIATEPLVALGGGTDAERVALQTRSPRAADLGLNALDAATLKLLAADAPEDAATTALMEAIAPSLCRVHPPEFESFGLVSRDRISARSGHPVRTLADRVARVFGVEEFDLYIHQAHSGGLEVEFGDPTAVMVPAHVANLPEPSQVFLLARIFAGIARGTMAIDKLPPRQLQALLTAGARHIDAGFGAGQGDDDYLTAHARGIYKGLPRRNRRAFEDAARHYLNAPKPARIEDWALRARMTSTRAAVLVADDLCGSITLLRRAEGDLARLQGNSLKRGMAVIGDAMRFAVSDSAAQVRRRIGLG